MATTSITCPRCGRTSYHPEDVKQGYCGACHWWTSDPQLAPYYNDANTPDRTRPLRAS